MSEMLDLDAIERRGTTNYGINGWLCSYTLAASDWDAVKAWVRELEAALLQIGGCSPADHNCNGMCPACIANNALCGGSDV
jgi:hypothetical protein